jgi:hypothetical protein
VILWKQLVFLWCFFRQGRCAVALPAHRPALPELRAVPPVSRRLDRGVACSELQHMLRKDAHPGEKPGQVGREPMGIHFRIFEILADCSQETGIASEFL